MRIFIFLFSLFTFNQLFSQDTTVTWIYKIDTSYHIQYQVSDIPNEFYTIIGISDSTEIVNANKEYGVGCTGSLPHKRLNWIAYDDKNHWILSVSYGGRGSGTDYYFLDKENGVINTNQLYFHGKNYDSLTLGLIAKNIKAKQFDRGIIK